MKKKVLTSIFLLCLLTFSITGCKKEEPVQESQTQEDVCTQDELHNGDAAKDTTALICSGCQEEKICGIYTIQEQEFIVCYDCSNELIEHNKEIADKQTCGGCQEEKICGTYIVDGQEYIVCPDDFEEFAYGMDL